MHLGLKVATALQRKFTAPRGTYLRRVLRESEDIFVTT